MRDRFADGVAATVGSWRFIITQSIVLMLWVVLNITLGFPDWKPEPLFIKYV
jgi:uncharacterized membrane protein